MKHKHLPREDRHGILGLFTVNMAVYSILNGALSIQRLAFFQLKFYLADTIRVGSLYCFAHSSFSMAASLSVLAGIDVDGK